MIALIIRGRNITVFVSWFVILFVFDVFKYFLSAETTTEIQQNSIFLATTFVELFQGVKEVKFCVVSCFLQPSQHAFFVLFFVRSFGNVRRLSASFRHNKDFWDLLGNYREV